MTDRSRSEDASIDLDDFHEWVVGTAEAEGTSPEAVIQQLMSTYWILNELTETLEETPYEHLLEQSPGDPSGDSDAEGEEEPGGEGKSEIVDVIKAIAELNSGPEATEPERVGGTIDPHLVDLVEAVREHAAQPSTGVDSNVTQFTFEIERLRNRLVSLDDDVKDVEETLDTVRESTEQDVEDVARRIEDVEVATDELEERFQSMEDRHERELSTLDATVDGLEDALARKADRESVEGLESRVDGNHVATQERLDAVEETFDEAYADIKRILSYLLDTSSEHGVVLDVLVDAFESDLEDLVLAHEDARRLEALKQAANRQGIRTAVCGTCEEPFDVSMLAEPRCPHCERDIDGFDARSFLWRTKYVAKPRQYQSESGYRPLRERVEEALSTSDLREDAPAPGETEFPHDED